MTVQHKVVQWTVLYSFEEYLLCVCIREDAVIWQINITIIITVCVPQSWSQVVRQTEALGRVMRSHADDLNSGPLHRLATLIRDKQQVKKSYQSLHQQLESHNHKVGNPLAHQRCATLAHPLTLLTEKTSCGQAV